MMNESDSKMLNVNPTPNVIAQREGIFLSNLAAGILVRKFSVIFLGIIFGAAILILGIFLSADVHKHTHTEGAIYRVDEYQNGRRIGSNYESGGSLNKEESNSTAGLTWMLLVAGSIILLKFIFHLLHAISMRPYFQRISKRCTFDVVWLGGALVGTTIPIVGIFFGLIVGMFFFLPYGIIYLSKKNQRRSGLVIFAVGVAMVAISVMQAKFFSLGN